MLKPIDAETKIDVIFIGDDAVDEETSDFEGYEKIMMDKPDMWREYIKAKSGQKITTFTIGVIPTNELNRIEDECRPNNNFNEMCWRCFCGGLYDIVDGPVESVMKNGRSVLEVPKDQDGRVNKQWLERIFCRSLRKVAVAIGLTVWHWNQFEEKDARP